MTGDNTGKEKAFSVASDPSASEKQWLAAVTLLEGYNPPGSSCLSKRLHPFIGLPWSLAVSALSGLGAFMIFGFLSAAVCDIASTVTGTFFMFGGPHAFALISAAFITFSSVFAYQKHIFGGGRVWSVMHYGLVVMGALLPVTLELVFQSASSLDSLSMFAMWGAGFIATSIMASRLASHSIAALESTVGARRVMPYSRNLFASFGALLLVLPVASSIFSYLTATWIWLPLVLLSSGYAIALGNKAVNRRTSAALALASWNPLILANLVLLPALLINSAAAVFVPSIQVLPADYALGFATLLCLVSGPLLGAQLASSVMQRSHAIELQRLPDEFSREPASSSLCYFAGREGDSERASENTSSPASSQPS